MEIVGRKALFLIGVTGFFFVPFYRTHAEFEALMRDYEGRPHWGKTFSRPRTELRTLYPAYDAFNRLRRACDPQGIFRNSFVDRVLPED